MNNHCLLKRVAFFKHRTDAFIASKKLVHVALLFLFCPSSSAACDVKVLEARVSLILSVKDY